MSSARAERLRKVFDYLVFSGVFTTRADFADAIGTNKTNLSSAMNGNEKYLSDSLFTKIHSVYDNISLQWLMTGEGEMLKVPATLTVYSPTVEERKEMSEGVDMSVIPAEVVEEIKEEVKAEMIVPIVPHEVALKAETNIKKFIEDNASELEHFDPRSVTAEVNGAERICSTSMSPTFLPGDVVFIRFLQEKSKITDGGIYYFDTSTRPTMIRLVKQLEDGRLLLKALNPRYGDIYVRKDEITNIGKITGMYRKTFGDQYAEIEEVRRKKDEQVDNLIEQNGKALQIIEELIKK